MIGPQPAAMHRYSSSHCLHFLQSRAVRPHSSQRCRLDRSGRQLELIVRYRATIVAPGRVSSSGRLLPNIGPSCIRTASTSMFVASPRRAAATTAISGTRPRLGGRWYQAIEWRQTEPDGGLRIGFIVGGRSMNTAIHLKRFCCHESGGSCDHQVQGPKRNAV